MAATPVPRARLPFPEIMRRDAFDGRHLLACARIEEPELAPPELARLRARR